MENSAETLLAVPVSSGYCIYVSSLCDGPAPVERNEQGYPIVYSTLEAAQRVIAEDIMDRIQEYLGGQREFEDAINPEEFIEAVSVYADGSIQDDSGNIFGTLD